MSAISDWCTGMLFALAIPVAKRVQNIMNALTARPDRNTKHPNARLAQPTMGTRLTRSASHPIGTAPSTKNADDAVAMNTIVPRLTPNVWRISGANTVIAALELLERPEEQQYHEHETAAGLERAGERDRLRLHARQQLVGEDDLLARASARPRASSSSSTVAASAAALPPPPVRRSRRPPLRRRSTGVSVSEPTSPPCGDPALSRVVVWSRPRNRALGLGTADRAALVRQFSEYGWVLVDALDPKVIETLPTWVDELAALRDGVGGVLQHREGTDSGPQLCRTENFTPVHHGMRQLLCEGAVVDVAGALLGEPAVLYKEKVNHKLPGGAGYAPHQGAPAYPMIDTHVSAMIAVDACDRGNGALEVVSACFGEVLPVDDRGCIEPAVAARLAWRPVALRPGQTLWFHSRTPHRSGPNRSSRAAGALPDLQRGAEGDRRAEYYARKRGRSRAPRPATAPVSRSSATSRGVRCEGGVHGARRAAPAPRRAVAHPEPGRARGARRACSARGPAQMTSATYPNHRDLRDRHRRQGARDRDQLGAVDPSGHAGMGAGCDVATLFDAVRSAGCTSAAVFGDQHLVGVTGATAADHHRPPEGEVPEGLGCDEMGYLHDADTATALGVAIDAAPDLVVAQLNGPDTAARARPRLRGCARRLPGHRRVARGRARPRAVGRHGLDPGVGPRSGAGRRARTVHLQDALDAHGDGLSAPRGQRRPRVRQRRSPTPPTGSPPSTGSRRAVRRARRRSRLLFGVDGTRPGVRVPRRAGATGHARWAEDAHAGRSGHRRPPGRRAARALERREVGAADWAPTIATLLDLDLPEATGRSLLLTRARRLAAARHDSSGSTTAPRTLAASSALAAPRRGRRGLRVELVALEGDITPPLEARVVSLRADSSSR